MIFSRLVRNVYNQHECSECGEYDHEMILENGKTVCILALIKNRKCASGTAYVVVDIESGESYTIDSHSVELTDDSDLIELITNEY